MNPVSKYKLGMIGIRVQELGRSSKLLRKDGWVRMHHAELNNRNAFDWVRWCKTQEEFFAMDWDRYSDRGLCAVACWISDAQWGRDDAITDVQWANRKTI